MIAPRKVKFEAKKKENLKRRKRKMKILNSVHF